MRAGFDDKRTFDAWFRHNNMIALCTLYSKSIEFKNFDKRLVMDRE